MNNERKLELTLCGMLPYGLKLKASTVIFHGFKKVKNEIITLNGINDDCIYYEESKNIKCHKSYVKPLLHSLDKLTDPILEGGLIPIVELLKIIHPKEDYTSKYGLISVSEVGHPCAWYTYSANFSLTIWLNDLEKTPFWIIEKLKEWHFNIYDLPKEMYIEKSTVNL